MPSWCQSSFLRCWLPAGVFAVPVGEQLWEQEHTHAHQWRPCHKDLYPPHSKTTHPVMQQPWVCPVWHRLKWHIQPKAGMKQVFWVCLWFFSGKDENTLCFLPQVQIVICLGNRGARENDNSKEFEELQVCCHGTCVNLSLMTFHGTTPAGARPDTSFAGFVHY